MNFKYITIEREYGSGGTKIARKLAEETGLPCYGKEILEAVSKANDIPERDVQRTQKHFNKKRANYYYANTAKRWDDMNNYDVILDSAVLGIDGCVNILKSVI